MQGVCRVLASAFARAEPVGVGTMLTVGSSCWESGGPEWLFDSAVVGILTAVAAGAVAWIAWAPPRVPAPSRRERLLSMLMPGVSFVFGSFAFFQSHRSSSDLAFALLVVALGVALVLLIEHSHRAYRAGVRLGGGAAAALGVVRWSAVVVASLATTVGVSSVVAMTAFGHSCTGV